MDLNSIDWDGLLKVGGGGAGITVLALLLKHFFASGTDLLGERRRRDESASARAVKWESDWRLCEKCRVLAERRLDLLTWSYDDLLKSFRELIEIPGVRQIAPSNLLKDAESARDAKAIVEGVQLQGNAD